MSKTIFENERGFFLSAGPAGNVYARTGQALLGGGGSLGPLQLVVECSEVTHKPTPTTQILTHLRKRPSDITRF